MDFGLPRALREEIRATHKRVTETTRRWRRDDGELAYAGSNASEYWAELSMWYFGSHGEYVDRQARVPPPGCHALAEYDPDGFRLLGLIYGGTHPLLRHDAVAPVTRLSPVAAAAVAGGGDEDAELPSVTLHFANLRGEAEAELWWADALLLLHAFLLLRLPPPPPSSSSPFLLLLLPPPPRTHCTRSTHSKHTQHTQHAQHAHARTQAHAQAQAQAQARARARARAQQP